MGLGEIVAFLGGSTVLIGIVAWLARELMKHLLKKDQDVFKHDMEAASARSLEQLKLDMTAQASRSLAEIQKNYQLEIDSTKRAADAETARGERIRAQIVQWANPILGAVRGLRSRLANILKDEAYLALHQQPPRPIPPGWSISYDYFMPTTLYLFCQFFYWVRRFESELSFELFRSQSDMDALLERLYAVRGALGKWPWEPRCAGRDAQVFALQQRAMGEALVVRTAGAPERAMGVDEFMLQWAQPPLATHLAPLHALLEDLDDDGACRWTRLQGVLAALEALEAHCRALLEPLRTAPQAPVREPQGTADAAQRA